MEEDMSDCDGEDRLLLINEAGSDCDEAGESNDDDSVLVDYGERIHHGLQSRDAKSHSHSSLTDGAVGGGLFVNSGDFAVLELRFLEAAIFLREGRENIKFEFHPTSPRQLTAFSRYHSRTLRSIDLLASVFILLLSIVELPSINTDLGVLPPQYQALAELGCIFVLCIKPYFMTEWIGFKNMLKRGRGWARLTLIVVGIIECIVLMSRNKHHFRITRFVRPFFLIDSPYSTGVRRVLRQIVTSLIPVIEMLLLLLFFMFIASIIAVYFFVAVPEDPFFGSLYSSFVSLFVLITTANFPDVMMPAYSSSAWSFLFFGGYLIIGLYFLQNLLLAVVYDTFRDKKQEKFRKLYMHRREGIRLAYRLLKDDRYGGIPFTHFRGLMRYLDRHRSLLSTRLLFLSLNKSGSDAINLEEFYEVFNALKLKWEKIPTRFQDNASAISNRGMLQQFGSKVTHLVKHKYFDLGMDIVIVINCVIVVVDASGIRSESQYIRRLKVSDYVFLAIYWLEAVLKVYALGPLSYWEIGWNKFDLCTTLISTFGFALGSRLSTFVALRQLRIMRLLSINKQFKFVLGTMFSLVPNLGSFAVALLLIFYSFAVLGIEVFAGKIYKGCCGDYYNGETSTQQYYLNNFDNLPRAFVTLFELLVVNNWFVIMDGVVTVTNDWARVYFMGFYIIAVNICLNVVIAFILETFLSRMTFQRSLKTGDVGSALKEEVILRLQDVVKYARKGRQRNTLRSISSDSNWVRFTGSRPMTMTDINLELFEEEVKEWCEGDLVLRSSMLHEHGGWHSSKPRRILSYHVSHESAQNNTPVKVRAMVGNIETRLPWALSSFQTNYFDEDNGRNETAENGLGEHIHDQEMDMLDYQDVSGTSYMDTTVDRLHPIFKEDGEMDKDEDENEDENGDEDEDEDELDDEEGELHPKLAKLVEAHREKKSPRWSNRQRTLLLSSRGISFRVRHLLSDLRGLLPHSKKDAKLDRKERINDVLPEICEMKNCNNCIYIEMRKKKDVYMWVSKMPHGPSIKFAVYNIHTLDELKLTGNCLKGSRHLVQFSQDFDSTPENKLIKEVLFQAFSVPNQHPKSKPFVDHIMSFFLLDGHIWFRNYQLSWPVDGKKGKDQETHLVEIGPRFVLEPIRIFEGTFGGPTLHINSEYVKKTVPEKFKD
eukprot:m.91481 g.91481  ORF g.91481 m.91481 type:complete len:1161 (-) comp8873_c0_seq1:51-3533(-)